MGLKYVTPETSQVVVFERQTDVGDGDDAAGTPISLVHQ